MSYSEGSMSTEQLKKLFGDSLQVRDDGHVTFSNDGDTDKFMNNSKLREVFTGAMGRSESDWDDGVSSENDLGTVVRYLSDGGDKPKEEKESETLDQKSISEIFNNFKRVNNNLIGMLQKQQQKEITNIFQKTLKM